jgi:Chromate transport protein ChrA
LSLYPLIQPSATELFAIGQGLPGPTSTQLVISTALARAGPLGGLLAFFLWNLPGLIVLTTTGVLIANFIDPDDPPFWLVGLPPAAIALVFKAMYGFGAKLDTLGVILALISASVAILISGDEVIKPTSSQYVFPSMLAAGALVAYIDSKRANPLGELFSTFVFYVLDYMDFFLTSYDANANNNENWFMNRPMPLFRHQECMLHRVRDGTQSQILP